MHKEKKIIATLMTLFLVLALILVLYIRHSFLQRFWFPWSLSLAPSLSLMEKAEIAANLELAVRMPELGLIELAVRMQNYFFSSAFVLPWISSRRAWNFFAQ